MPSSRPHRGTDLLAPDASVAVVGAGVAGLAVARSLQEAGCRVVLFEKLDEIGGVWSAARAYPGIATQDDRGSYTYSDLPMPSTVAPHPAGADVRDYLQRYARAHGLESRVRFRTEVLSATPVDGDAWEVESSGPDGRVVERYDWLVAANGVFSTPNLPTWPGRDAFEAAGGRVVTPASIGDGTVLDGHRTVVVGWGKTACDLAAVAAGRGTRTDVIARTLTWKYPKRIGARGLTFHHLVLTRAGERLIGTSYRTSHGRVMLRRLPERIPRVLLGKALGRAVDQALGLSALGLRSDMEFRASTSLVTDGFFEAVEDGRITVHRGRSVVALGSDMHGPWVRLSDDTVLHSDVVLAATGYQRDVRFLSPDVVARITDADGNLLLHNTVLAAGAPHLAFIGWLQNYRSPLTAELLSIWLAALLLGRAPQPGAEWRRDAARVPLVHDRSAAAGAVSLPSMNLRDLDRLLGEAGLHLPLRTRVRQIWTPLDPSDYVGLLGRLLEDVGRVPVVPVPAARGEVVDVA